MAKEFDAVTLKYYHSLRRYQGLFHESSLHWEDYWKKMDYDWAHRVISHIYKDEEIDKKKLKVALKLFPKGKGPYLPYEAELDPVDAVELRFPGLVAQISAKFGTILDDLSKYMDYDLDQKYQDFVLALSDPYKCCASIVAIRMIENKFLSGDTKFIARFINRAVSTMKTCIAMEKGRDYYLAGLAYRINHFAENYRTSPYSPITSEQWKAIVEEEFEGAFPDLSPQGVYKELEFICDCFSGKYVFDGGYNYNEGTFYKKSQAIRDGTLFYAYLVYIANGDEDFSLSNVYDKIMNYDFSFGK